MTTTMVREGEGKGMVRVMGVATAVVIV